MVVLFQPPRVEPDPDQVFTNGQPLENFHNFAYLDSSVYDEAKLDAELEKHVARAPSTFGWLCKRLWNTDHVNNEREPSGVQGSCTHLAALWTWDMDTLPEAS